MIAILFSMAAHSIHSKHALHTLQHTAEVMLVIACMPWFYNCMPCHTVWIYNSFLVNSWFDFYLVINSFIHSFIHSFIQKLTCAVAVTELYLRSVELLLLLLLLLFFLVFYCACDQSPKSSVCDRKQLGKHAENPMPSTCGYRKCVLKNHYENTFDWNSD